MRASFYRRSVFLSLFLCPFPWLTPCVTTDGHFRVCPVSQSAPSRGEVKNANGTRPHIVESQDVRNAQSLKDLRRNMRSGADVGETCKRCLAEESFGLQSRRQMELARHPEFNQDFVDKWTAEDGTLNEGAPVATVILRMGNKCNLVCRMCGPSSSSAWYKEWAETRHAGYQEESGRVQLLKTNGGAFQCDPDVYSWSESSAPLEFIKSCGPSLRGIHFSGGEPILSRSHAEILRYLVDSGRSSVISLDYNSNMTVLPQEILELWEKFRWVEVGFSIDGPPELNEYIRYPVKTAALLRNLQRLDQSKVPGKFWLSATVQIYNVLYMDDLQDWLDQQQFRRISSEVHWHVLRAPKELSIFALPESVKKLVAARLEQSPRFAKLADMIFEKDESEHFEEFLHSTRLMDTYRGQSLQQFEGLVQIFRRAGVLV